MIRKLFSPNENVNHCKNITRVLVVIAGLTIVPVLDTNAQSIDWVLHIGGPNDELSSHRIAVDDDGNAIISGAFKGTIQIGTRSLTSVTPLYTDVFVAKVSPSGTVTWVTQISGSSDERTYRTRVAIDRWGNIFLPFYSSSSEVNVGSQNVRLESPTMGRARLVKLNPQGEYQWSIVDAGILDFSQGNDGWVQVNVDNGGNATLSVTGWCNGSEVRRYSSDGKQQFRSRYQLGKSDNCGTPRVWSLASDTGGNVYTALGFNVETDVFDTTYRGTFDILLLKQSSIGNIVWVRPISSTGIERVSKMLVRDNRLTVYGSYGANTNNSNLWITDPVDFGGKTLQRKDATSGFAAEYNLDGQLLGVHHIPTTPGYGMSEEAIIEIEERGDTIVVESPGDGLLYFTSSGSEWLYKRGTYALKQACGSNYIMSEFKDTVSLENDRYRLVSRGGKDIYLALLKPATKYVPVRPGLRFPVDSAVDLDIPVQVDWWWVGCANGYRLQLSRDSAMTQVVFDTTYALQPPYTLKNLEHLTKYYWRVRANTADTFSVWSDVRSFTTVKAQPADVVLEYPVNGSRGMQRQVTLRWTASKRASSYLVDVASDSAFANRVINGKLVSASALDVTLDANRTYYWRVRAGNAAGSSPWSEVWKFDVRPDAPARTILDKPSNGALQEPINTVFGWLSQGDGLEYRLHVARDSAFGFIDLDKSTSNAYWQGTLEPSTTYFWRVRASNGYDDGAWSPTWSFSTGTTTSVDEDDSSPNVRASYADGALLIHLSDDLQQMRSLAISLFDLSGRQLISTIADNTGSPLRIAVPNLAHGTYVLRIGEESGEKVSVKVSY
jgi:hypothetical protein